MGGVAACSAGGEVSDHRVGAGALQLPCAYSHSCIVFLVLWVGRLTMCANRDTSIVFVPSIRLYCVHGHRADVRVYGCRAHSECQSRLSHKVYNGLILGKRYELN